MKAALAAVLGLVLTGATVWGLRFVNRPPPPVPAAAPPTKPHVRTRVVERVCPRTGELDARLEEIGAETARLRSLVGVAELRRDQIGEPLADDVLERLAPEVVRPELERLLADAPDVRWSCDSYPCSAVALFDPADTDAATALADAVNEAFPEASGGVVGRDGEGYATVGEPAALSVFIQVVDPPTDTSIDRAWFHRRSATEHLLRDLRADPLPR
ncbi:MAG: hypothetical protein KC621_17790 [Myxococcales bacterium]|nr:hypothetical protein [Myxococcales bacterium]